jgi:hypothetical protein
MYNSSNTASARLFISQRERTRGDKNEQNKTLEREREKEAHTNNAHTAQERI